MNIIPLGRDCTTADFIHSRFGCESLPFDYTVSHLNCINKVLGNGYQKVLKEFSQVNDNIFEDVYSGVQFYHHMVMTEDGIKFINHNKETKSQQPFITYDEFYSHNIKKYERLFELLEDENIVIITLNNLNTIDYSIPLQDLCNILDSKFSSKFEILVITHERCREFYNDIDERIKLTYVKDGLELWKGPQWKVDIEKYIRERYKRTI
jgi:uncharacterized short protein YbdD (DUF466 family)